MAVAAEDQGVCWQNLQMGGYGFVEEGYLEGRTGVDGSIFFGKLLEIKQLIVVQFAIYNSITTTLESNTTLVKITWGFNSLNNIRRDNN